MQKIFFALIAIPTILYFGCSTNDQLNKTSLRKIIIEAIAGDVDANNKLQGMLSQKHLGRNDYNQLDIDSIVIDNRLYFSVILEYPDPTLNLFAIYDGDLNFYLMDKSLNGYLSSEFLKVGDRKFVFVQERFLTKDVLSIDRLSIYEIFDGSASLIYRGISRLGKDNIESFQTIEAITDDYILTKITGAQDNRINNRIDTFYFSSATKKYSSRSDWFHNYVKQEVRDYNWIIIKPQITAEFSDPKGEVKDRRYKISLDNEWGEIPGYIEDKLVKQPLKGEKYINKSLNSSFTILSIPSGDEGEKYSPYILSETRKGDYNVRASAVFEIGESYLQIFEHTCGANKYFLLFQCPKSIYIEKNKLFLAIINSFTVDCF